MDLFTTILGDVILETYEDYAKKRRKKKAENKKLGKVSLLDKAKAKIKERRG